MTHYLKKELYDLIKKDERIFDFIQEGSLDGLWYWDLEKPENEWMNARFWKVLGYNPDEMPHKTSAWQSIINQYDLKVALDNFNKHLENPHHPYDQIVRYKHKDNSTVWIRCRGVAIRNENGNPTRMLGAHQDITALKQTENQLQHEKEIASENEAKYRAMFENAPLAFQSLDENGKIIDVNPQWLKILGYKKEETVGKWFGDFLHPDSAGFFKKRFPIFKKEGFIHDVEFRMITKKGNSIFVSFEGCIGLDETGAFKQTYCTFKDITKEKEAESRIKESENLFKIIFEQSATGISRLSPEGKFLQVNKRFCEITGYSEEELLSMDFTRITHPDDLHLDKEYHERVVNNKIDHFNFEKRYIHKNKSVIWIRLFSNVVRKANGNVNYTISTIVDITQQKNAQNELLRSEARYKQLVETASDAIYLMDEKGIIIDTNQISTRMLQKSKDEIIGSKIDTVDPNFPVEAFIEFWKSVPYGEQKIFETTHITKNGKWIPIEISAKKFKIDKKTYYFGLARNITERKKANAALAESEEKFRGVFRYANIGIVLSDESGNIFDVNEEFTQMLGYTREEFISFNFADLSTPEENEKEMPLYRKILEGKIDNYRIEKKIRKKGGKFLWLDISIAGRRNPEGKVIMFIAMAINITERKMAEQELIAAKEKAEESNRLKTEFLNNMSHEIRTPMNGIIGFSEMLDKNELTQEKRKYYAKIVQNSSHQLLRIIDDILEISTLETKQIAMNEEVFCLNDLLMELFSVFNLKSNERNIPIYIKKTLHDNQSLIISDKTKLNKILSNLLENALKFTGEGFIEMGYFIKDTNLILYVKDTGIGISPEHHKTIFDRFSQEEKGLSQKLGGLGLGLSISKENAMLLGGDITLESEKGKGSTFYVRIPYKSASQTDKDLPDYSRNKEKEASEEHTILVAEDEEINFLFIEAILEGKTKPTFNIIHAKNGKEAVDLCIQHKNIELVLMDLKMPVMDGEEATSKIKIIRPDLPVIAQTAYSSEANKTRAREHGCDDFISKPLDRDRLFGLIEKYMRKETDHRVKK